MRHIDIAVLECTKCGHRSTPPDAINALPHVMETYEVLPAEKLENETTKLATLTSEHEGNMFSVETIYAIDPKDETKWIADKKIIKCTRSYAVAIFDKTTLEDSNHITLSCPQCNALLYEVRWRPGR